MMCLSMLNLFKINLIWSIPGIWNNKIITGRFTNNFIKMPLVNVCFSVSCKYSLYDHHELKHSLSASNRLSNGCLVGRLINVFLDLIEYRWLFPGKWNICMGKYECRNELRDVNENKVEVRGRCIKGVYVNEMTCFL